MNDAFEDFLAAAAERAFRNAHSIHGPTQQAARELGKLVIEAEKELAWLSWAPVSSGSARALEIEAVQATRAARIAELDALLAAHEADHAAKASAMLQSIEARAELVQQISNLERKLEAVRNLAPHPSATPEIRAQLESDLATKTAELAAFQIAPYGVP